MFSSPMKTALQPARAAFSMKPRNGPVAERVDLQQEPDPKTLILRKSIQAIEDRLPVAVAGEIVIRNEEARDRLRGVGAHDRLDIVGSSVARLAALNVDDGAEAALERAAPRVSSWPSR